MSETKEWKPSDNEYWKKVATERSTKNDNKDWKSYGFDMTEMGPKCSDYWIQGVESGTHRLFRIPALARLARGSNFLVKGVTKADVEDFYEIFHDATGAQLKYGKIAWASEENIRCPVDWTVFDPINGKCVCIYDARNKLVLKFEPNAKEHLGEKILTFYP